MPHTAVDHLASYIAGVSKLPEKMALIAANHRSSEASLGRAAAALRSMAALSRHRSALNSKNHASTDGNASSVPL